MSLFLHGKYATEPNKLRLTESTFWSIVFIFYLSSLITHLLFLFVLFSYVFSRHLSTLSPSSWSSSSLSRHERSWWDGVSGGGGRSAPTSSCELTISRTNFYPRTDSSVLYFYRVRLTLLEISIYEWAVKWAHRASDYWNRRQRMRTLVVP